MTHVHCDYVADERDVEPGTYDITDYDTAAGMVGDYLTTRMRDVVAAWPGRPVLMLSGGIDSVLLATYVADVAPHALAVTYAQPGDDEQVDRELDVAHGVADTLGLEHKVVSPEPDQFISLVRDVARALDTTEPWEVLAGTVLKAVDTAAGTDDAAIISGAGADGLFMGGQQVDFGADPVAAWDRAMRGNIAKNFTRHRFIPTFYERLIRNHERHILTWQTHAAVDLAQRIDPYLIRGTNLDGDKVLFRRMAEDRGLDADLVGATKNPMQVSSGGVGAVVAAARRALADDYGEKTYSNPLTEPADFTVSRLYLQRLTRD